MKMIHVIQMQSASIQMVASFACATEDSLEMELCALK